MATCWSQGSQAVFNLLCIFTAASGQEALHEETPPAFLSQAPLGMSNRNAPVGTLPLASLLPKIPAQNGAAITAFITVNYKRNAYLIMLALLPYFLWFNHL